MSFLYLEARKGILRRYTLIALALFLCLNTVKIIADYHAGEIRPVAANTSGMQAGYDTIYERIKGPITEETVRFLTSEYQRLDALTADGTYSREPQEETYSGYIFGDYYLLHSYFYPHMEYSVKYSSDMEEILAQAKENMTFYQESGNTAGAAENAYILHHYAGRTIPAFYLYDGWEALLSYDFSDLSADPAFTHFGGSARIHAGEGKRDDPDSVLLQTRQMASAYFQMRRWSDICMDTDNPVRPVKPPGIWAFVRF